MLLLVGSVVVVGSIVVGLGSFLVVGSVVVVVVSKQPSIRSTELFLVFNVWLKLAGHLDVFSKTSR